MAKDYYKTLGISEDASPDEIKKQFRRLAKKYHPDRNTGKAESEAQFKEINEAYEVLKDPGRRREYDTMRKYGSYAGAPGANGFSAYGFDPGAFGFSSFGNGGFTFRTAGGQAGSVDNIEEMLASLFGGNRFSRTGRAQAGPVRGADLATTLHISFLEAARGTKKTIRLQGRKQSLSVKIPAGVENGRKIRLRGQGEPGLYGGPNGDLIITVEVMPHQEFTRKGNDVYSSVEISFVEAIKGCKKTVKTLAKTVTLSIPAGTQPGTKLRLKGMGLHVGGVQGDQYVEVKVRIPTQLTDKQKRLLEEWGSS